MAKKFRPSTFHWWLYTIYVVVGLFFVCPYLISLNDTIGVMVGVILLVLMGVWSWGLWIKRFIHFLEDYSEE